MQFQFIAATAIANNLILITDNEKDFVNIPNLKVINPKNINSNPGL
jgi:predicted nucleic acid-binding protein